MILTPDRLVVRSVGRRVELEKMKKLLPVTEQTNKQTNKRAGEENDKENPSFIPSNQCDLMARRWAKFWPFTTMNICPIAQQICQSRFKILQNIQRKLKIFC